MRIFIRGILILARIPEAALPDDNNDLTQGETTTKRG
jgi:hypothetical protein